ncbi:MAG: alpha/beta fold hydrolase [Xanthomonadaceae bacterium]|nr:alpha/beta fold hydrolase [Xanthomonadaceae bacterium]MDE1885702.1 alpha/beta fold hydrolase [Xanthomonadaceae bacterium]MDE2084234.1 alpha/beta fold hydrolase [Xanthomonadaceae bacterium]
MIKNVEFHLPGGRNGVLLIHGLTGTPTEMRFVAKGLNRNGFTVHGMQLAGHCGDEADLLATGRQDWYRSVVAAAEKLRGEVDHLFVAGLSMGALLALKLAADRPDMVDGLGLYGTTFVYDGWTIPWIGKLSFMLPLVVSLGFGRHRKFHECFPYGIKDERIRQRIAGSMLSGDSAAAGLPGNPWPSLAEFYRLSWRVRRLLSSVRTPCLVVHAKDDDVASLRNVRTVVRGVSGPVETVLLENSYHMITVDQERDLVIERSTRFFNAVAATRFVTMPEHAPAMAAAD